MLLEISAKQSQIGGLMIRGIYRLNGTTDGGYHAEMQYLGYDKVKDEEVYGLAIVAGNPSDSETTEAKIEFDFYHHQHWVREVRIVMMDEVDTLLLVEHLGREG